MVIINNGYDVMYCVVEYVFGVFLFDLNLVGLEYLNNLWNWWMVVRKMVKKNAQTLIENALLLCWLLLVVVYLLA